MLCNKKAVGKTNGLVNSGGDKRDRTADLLNAIQALSQLSYTPIFGSLFGQLLYYSIPAEFVNSFFSFFQRPFFSRFSAFVAGQRLSHVLSYIQRF